MKFSYILTPLLVVTLLASCTKKEEETQPAISVPSAYNATNYTTNAADEIALGERFEALADEMDLGASTANTLSATTLKTLFDAGTPSLSDVTPANLKTAMTTTGGWFDLMATASGNTWTPAIPNGSSTGGVFAGATKAYLYDPNGVQYNEVIEKVLNNASFYNHVIELTSSSYDAKTADKILAIYGAQHTFANSNNAVLHPNDYDRFTANYVARRDKNDGKGFYTKIKNNLIIFQASLQGGSAYNTSRNEALKNIKKNWERAMLASAINYSNDALSTLSKTTLTDNDKTAALHSISEAIGFIVAWYGVPQEHRTITDAQVATCLTYLEFSLTSVPTTYEFITNNSPTQLAQLTALNETIKGIYGFTNAEMIDFKTNWVSQQGR